MNKLLLDTKYKGLEHHLELGYEAIEKCDFELPLSFLPYEMHHHKPIDAWDVWENKRFESNLITSMELWNRILNLARRIKKLERKRLINPLYCSKSDLNIKKKHH
jgi:hypothetical protein